MENLRENYRHYFLPGFRAKVKLETHRGEKTAEGEIVSLSLGGMGLHIEDRKFYLHMREKLDLTFVLPGQGVKMTVGASICHVRPMGNGWHYGLQFQPLAERSKQTQRDKQLWAFLLVEQRKAAKNR